MEENRTELQMQENMDSVDAGATSFDAEEAQTQPRDRRDRHADNRRDYRNSRGGSRGRYNKRRREEKKDPIKDEVVHIGRVAKTVKGGRNIRFTALVIAGDGKGQVGMGLGKAAEVPDAIRKGNEIARKSMIKVPISGTTIPHICTGVFGGGKVLMKPAPEGTGIIAGGPVRAVCTLAGITDVRTKSLGSNNPKNMVEATFDALKNLSSLEEVAERRGKTVQEIIG